MLFQAETRPSLLSSLSTSSRLVESSNFSNTSRLSSTSLKSISSASEFSTQSSLCEQFATKTFFLDISDAAVRDQLKQKILLLGGTVEEFWTKKKITDYVSDNIDQPRTPQKIQLSAVQSPGRMSRRLSQSLRTKSMESKNNENVEDVVTHSNLLDAARDQDKRIHSAALLLSQCNEALSSTAPATPKAIPLQKKTARRTLTASTPTTSNLTKADSHPLLRKQTSTTAALLSNTTLNRIVSPTKPKYPTLILTQISAPLENVLQKSYMPKEDVSTVPSINFDFKPLAGITGPSPFLPTNSSKLRSPLRTQRANPTQPQQENKEAQSPRDASSSLSPTRKRRKGKRPRTETTGGYCECCKKKFKVLKEHLVSKDHTDYESNDKNYECIDILFIQLQQRQDSHQSQSPQRQEQQRQWRHQQQQKSDSRSSSSSMSSTSFFPCE